MNPINNINELSSLSDKFNFDSQPIRLDSRSVSEPEVTSGNEYHKLTSTALMLHDLAVSDSFQNNDEKAQDLKIYGRLKKCGFPYAKNDDSVVDGFILAMTANTNTPGAIKDASKEYTKNHYDVFTPLMLATAVGNEGAMKITLELLGEKVPDIDDMDMDCKTALSYAVILNDFKAAKFLLENGAKTKYAREALEELNDVRMNSLFDTYTNESDTSTEDSGTEGTSSDYVD